MATKTFVKLVDDLTGDILEEGEGQTISFSFENRAYKIDLASERAEEFRQLMEKYVKAGQQVGTTGTTGGSRRTSTSSRKDKGYLQSVRAWADKEGIQLNSRGRIKQEILDQYDAAHGA